jgi:hypothetical protein
MTALRMIVRQGLLDRSLQSTLASHDHPLQGLLLDGAYKSFAVRVHIEMPRREDEGSYPSSLRRMTPPPKPALFHASHHGVLPRTSWRQPVRIPEVTLGRSSAQVWRPRTPVMAASLTNHVWDPTRRAAVSGATVAAARWVRRKASRETKSQGGVCAGAGRGRGSCDTVKLARRSTVTPLPL